MFYLGGLIVFKLLFSLHVALIFSLIYYYYNFIFVNKIVSGAILHRLKHNKSHVYRFLVITTERCQLTLLTACYPVVFQTFQERLVKYEMKSNNNSGNFSAPCRNITPVHDFFCSSVFLDVWIWFQPHRFPLSHRSIV